MKYILCLVYLIIGISVSAQKMNKDYIFFPQETGNLYFIYPQKGFISKNKTDVKGLEYDITFLATNDSLTFSYTYINKEICKSEIISFLSADDQIFYQEKARMLFVQPLKNNWEHRVSVKVPYSKAIELYALRSPFRLKFHTNKQDIQYQITEERWKKQQYMINRIFEIITNNN